MSGQLLRRGIQSPNRGGLEHSFMILLSFRAWPVRLRFGNDELRRMSKDDYGTIMELGRGGTEREMMATLRRPLRPVASSYPAL